MPGEPVADVGLGANEPAVNGRHGATEFECGVRVGPAFEAAQDEDRSVR